MKFCVKRIPITTAHPVMQAGFAARTHLSEGVHDDCFMRVVWLADPEPLVLVSFDLLYAAAGFAHGVRNAISAAVGIDGSRVRIAYTHTHGFIRGLGEEDAASPLGLYYSQGVVRDYNCDDPIDPAPDLAFFRDICRKAADLAIACRDEAIPGNLIHRRTTSYFGVNRRVTRSDGNTIMAPNPDDSLIDPTLDILTLEDTAGMPRAILWSYACHPTICGGTNYLITADYPGAVGRELEKAYPGIVPVFLQGCCADINPRAAADGEDFKSSTPAEMEAAAAPLAAEILSTLRKPGRILSPSLHLEIDCIQLYAEQNGRDWWQSIIDDPATPYYRLHAARVGLRRFDAGLLKREFPFPMSCIRLDSKLFMLLMPNEVVSFYGKRIRALFPGLSIITMGYTESSCCYVPTRDILKNGGYEAGAFLDAGLTGPFVPEIEDIIVGHAAAMLTRAQKAE
ncbi:MAG: hypothetical protein E7463_14865 [Ruminococcaceae bacterium]|nr:hypothetical protein [Oscillospiraceae bacterium]